MIVVSQRGPIKKGSNAEDIIIALMSAIHTFMYDFYCVPEFHLRLFQTPTPRHSDSADYATPLNHPHYRLIALQNQLILGKHDPLQVALTP